MPAEIKARLELVTGGGGVPAAGVMPGKRSEEGVVMKDMSSHLKSISLFLKRPSSMLGGGLFGLLAGKEVLLGIATLIGGTLSMVITKELGDMFQEGGLKEKFIAALGLSNVAAGPLGQVTLLKELFEAIASAEIPDWLKKLLGIDDGGPGKDPTMPASPRPSDLVGVSVPVASQLIGYYGGTLAQSLDEEEMLRLVQAQKKELNDMQELAVNILLHNADLTEEQQNQFLILVEQGIEAANLYGSTKDTLEMNRLLTEEYNRQLQVLKSMARYRSGRTRGLDLETTFEGRTYTGYASSSVTDVRRLEQSSYAHIRALVEQGTFG